MDRAKELAKLEAALADNKAQELRELAAQPDLMGRLRPGAVRLERAVGRDFVADGVHPRPCLPRVPRTSATPSAAIQA